MSSAYCVYKKNTWYYFIRLYVFTIFIVFVFLRFCEDFSDNKHAVFLNRCNVRNYYSLLFVWNYFAPLTIARKQRRFTRPYESIMRILYCDDWQYFVFLEFYNDISRNWKQLRCTNQITGLPPKCCTVRHHEEFFKDLCFKATLAKFR